MLNAPKSILKPSTVTTTTLKSTVKPQTYIMLGISIIVCRNRQGKWLTIKESNNRGWYLPCGKVIPPESFYEAGRRECKEEAGIDIEIKGVLRIEYSIASQYQRIRAIFYAEPIDENQQIKLISDKESEEVRWVTKDELLKLKDEAEGGWRGTELYDWINYIENNGIIYPCSVLIMEGEDIVTKQISDLMVTKGIKNDQEILERYQKALELNDEKSLQNKQFCNDLLKLKDKNGNNVLQMSILHKRVNFTKLLLVLITKEGDLLAKNSNNQNIFHSLIDNMGNNNDKDDVDMDLFERILIKMLELSSKTSVLEMLKQKDKLDKIPLDYFLGLKESDKQKFESIIENMGFFRKSQNNNLEIFVNSQFQIKYPGLFGHRIFRLRI